MDLLSRPRSALGGFGLAVVALVLLAGMMLAYTRWSQRAALPEGLVQANGRIEGDRITVASKVPGRVRALRAREGDTVRAGQVVVLLDDAQAVARVAQARAALAQAVSRRRHADAVVGEADTGVARARAAVAQAEAATVRAAQAVVTLESRVRAAETGLSVLRRETDVALETAQAGLAQARSAVTHAEATEVQTRRDAERYARLAEQGLVEPQRAELAELAWTAAHSGVVAARSALLQAEQRLADARLGPDRIRARESERSALESERAQAEAGVTEARAAVDEARLVVGQGLAALAQAQAGRAAAAAAEAQARAAVDEAESAHGDLSIVAPADGVVTTRTINIGEVIGAGAPLLELADLDRLYLRVFVAETDIGKVRLGLPARIYTDAFPDRPVAATVRYIASRAEFTPKEIQTADERVKLVYAVKLYLDANPEHRLTPGLPGDAVIRWNEAVPWQRPRW
jgi:HlyD family secretion protein